MQSLLGRALALLKGGAAAGPTARAFSAAATAAAEGKRWLLSDGLCLEPAVPAQRRGTGSVRPASPSLDHARRWPAACAGGAAAGGEWGVKNKLFRLLRDTSSTQPLTSAELWAQAEVRGQRPWSEACAALRHRLRGACP